MHAKCALADRRTTFATSADLAGAEGDTGYTDVTRMVAVEFITMMAAIDRLAEAAGVLAHLDTTGDFGRLARDHLVAVAVHRIGLTQRGC